MARNLALVVLSLSLLVVALCWTLPSVHGATDDDADDANTADTDTDAASDTDTDDDAATQADDANNADTDTADTDDNTDDEDADEDEADADDTKTAKKKGASKTKSKAKKKTKTDDDNDDDDENADDNDEEADEDNDDTKKKTKKSTKKSSKTKSKKNTDGDDNDEEDEEDENDDNDEDDDDENDNKKKKNGRKNSKAKRKKGRQNEDDDNDDDEEEEGDENDENEDDDQRYNGAADGANGTPELELLRCQDRKGDFLPIATVCKDHESKHFCEAVFPTKSAADVNSHGRSRNCDLPGLKSVAYKCAHHCKICCELKEYGCGDDPRYPINCATNIEKCHNMTGMMAAACASTCGLCHTGSCVDQVDGCIVLRHMCDQEEFKEEMQKCARTCGFCTAKCADVTQDCLIADPASCLKPPADHPEQNPYYESMAKACRATCHLCYEKMPLDRKVTQQIERRTRQEEEDAEYEFEEEDEDEEEDEGRGARGTRGSRRTRRNRQRDN